MPLEFENADSPSCIICQATMPMKNKIKQSTIFPEAIIIEFSDDTHFLLLPGGAIEAGVDSITSCVWADTSITNRPKSPKNYYHFITILQHRQFLSG